MKRRDFIRNTALATASLLSMPAWAKPQNYELVTIRGGSAKGMLDLGINTLGGIERFVKDGQKVLIKPTLRWDKTPEQAANTNPDLLAKMVELCYEAGSRGVYLVDQTIDPWTKVYKTSGVERAVKDAYAKILPGNRESLYQDTKLSEGKNERLVKLHEIVNEVDVIINMPVLKLNTNLTMNGALSNLKSLVWQPDQYSDDLIFDLLNYKKPVLNVIDAFRIITENSPADNTDENITTLRRLILSPDIVAADSFAANLLGIDPNELSLIKEAENRGFGQVDLSEGQIKRIILKQQTTGES